MLSYQHIYHAGCLADVHKHSLLSVILEHMTAKGKPLTYMETHAGRGFYNLAAPEAQKTGEYKEGIEAILSRKALPEGHPFMRVLNDVRQAQGANAYPGSPSIAQVLLKDYDSIHLMELHPTEFQELRKNMRCKTIHIHNRDGYEGVLALSPPNPRRGLIFVDPSYEVKREYSQVVRFIEKLSKKWPEAVIALWYPMLQARYHEDLVDDIQSLGLKDTLVEELEFGANKTGKGIYGSGMILINTPYGLKEKLAGVLL